jgi:hypothetical protein
MRDIFYICLLVAITLASNDQIKSRNQAAQKIVSAIESNGCTNSHQKLNPLLDRINETQQ